MSAVARVEPDRISLATMVAGGVVFVAFIVVCAFVARALLFGAAHGEPLYRAAPPRAADEIGWVEQTPVLDAERGLAEKREQQAELRKWGWVDRDHGVARVPIDRAIDLVVQNAARDGGP